MKRLIKVAARRLGYDIIRANSSPRGSMQAALSHVAHRHRVDTVVDVGASDGRWSKVAQRYYPEASFLLFEAQVGPHGDALRGLTESDSRFHLVLAAAGDSIGKIHFDASDPQSGVASPEPTGAHDIVVPMTTVDLEVQRLGLPPPYLIKLDTHGFEVPILEGARKTLEQAAVLVIEAYNFELRTGSLRFPDLCDHVELLGFRVVDLVDALWRPRDGALWQFDLLFVRDDQPEFASNAYH